MHNGDDPKPFNLTYLASKVLVLTFVCDSGNIKKREFKKDRFATSPSVSESGDACNLRKTVRTPTVYLCNLKA
jgi:hypothetical protein